MLITALMMYSFVPWLGASEREGAVTSNKTSRQTVELKWSAPSRQEQRPNHDEQRECQKADYLPSKGRLKGPVQLFYQRSNVLRLSKSIQQEAQQFCCVFNWSLLLNEHSCYHYLAFQHTASISVEDYLEHYSFYMHSMSFSPRFEWKSQSIIQYTKPRHFLPIKILHTVSASHSLFP